MTRTLAAIFVCIALVLAPRQVAAHDWYPCECCSGQDCYPVSSVEIRLTKEGAYIVVSTGEIFAHPDSAAPIRKARFSTDGQYHRCTPNGERGNVYTICLFIPRAPES